MARHHHPEEADPVGDGDAGDDEAAGTDEAGGTDDAAGTDVAGGTDDAAGTDEAGGTDEAATLADRGSEPTGRPMTHPPDGRRGRGAVARRGARKRDPVRATVRGVGQLLITAGVVVLLFVVYELWITNIFGDHRQAAATEQLDKLWATEQVTVTQSAPVVVTESGDAPALSGVPTPTAAPGTSGARTRHYDTTEGSGFAKLYIPSFGADFVLTVIEGTSENDLYAGPGHYLGTQYPGEAGNFSVAGHRVNKGAPFNDLDLLKSCDSIVVETVDSWYVYRVLPMQDQIAGWSGAAHPHCDGVAPQSGQYAGVYGREITDPSDYQQVLPVPHVNSTSVPTGAEKLITLTTCNPKFSDAQRMIIHGIEVKSYPKNGSFLPPELGETT
jgi:sortase (surface protein transpeptidase)